MLGFFIIIGIFLLVVGIGALFGAPYVPSQRRYLKRAFDELYPLQSTDVLVDIGAGDGVILREASERGARAIGYEINPILYVVARWMSRRHDRVSVRLSNFWTSELPEETTVVYAFSVNRDAAKLTRKLQAHVDETGRPVALLCLGSPLTAMTPEGSLDAYTLYHFLPSLKPHADKV